MSTYIFQSNYVLENDDLLDAIQPEYDAIMCLSTTKWMHLNFGDEGLKRAFKRMYAQLRYGGRLVLEAQVQTFVTGLALPYLKIYVD